jgi:LytS/YehU family sensor histidine kinase
MITRMTMVRSYAYQQEYSKPKSIFIAFAIFRILLALFLSASLVVYERWKQSEKEKLIAELSFLKAQINPHFLFNTLNGIYTLVLKKADNAAESVSKLSALMQYVATDASSERVALENEITYISNYIDLQKLRMTNSTQINYTVTGTPAGLEIEPLLMISFIENAFKYGVSTEHSGTIDISIHIISRQLQLIVKNNKIRKSLLNNSEDGIGLDNTKKRLIKNYNNKHQLNIQESEKEYSVNLILQLK